MLPRRIGARESVVSSSIHFHTCWLLCGWYRITHSRTIRLRMLGFNFGINCSFVVYILTNPSLWHSWLLRVVLARLTDCLSVSSVWGLVFWGSVSDDWLCNRCVWNRIWLCVVVWWGRLPCRVYSKWFVWGWRLTSWFTSKEYKDVNLQDTVTNTNVIYGISLVRLFSLAECFVASIHPHHWT